MSSGKLNRKPSDAHRDHINARTRKALIEAGKKIGHLTDSQKITPSERRSHLMRKKLTRGISEPIKVAMKDCRGCEKQTTGCAGDISSDACTERSVPTRCVQCGGRTIVRVIFGDTSERYLCPVCSGEGGAS